VIPAAQHNAISKLARKTNHIERFNNTLRQRVSRLVRDALSFSKKLANHGSSALNRLSLPKTFQSVSHQNAFN
jgi:IS1 family transposase